MALDNITEDKKKTNKIGRYTKNVIIVNGY